MREMKHAMNQLGSHTTSGRAGPVGRRRPSIVAHVWSGEPTLNPGRRRRCGWLDNVNVSDGGLTLSELERVGFITTEPSFVHQRISVCVNILTGHKSVCMSIRSSPVVTLLTLSGKDFTDFGL